MNRRAAIAQGVCLGGALLLAPRAFAVDDADRAVAEFLPPPTTFEQAAWAIFRLAAASGELAGLELTQFERMRDRADEHASAIEAVWKGLGTAPPRRPQRKEEVPLPGFYAASTRDDYIRFATEAQRGAIAAWYAALQKLRQPEVLGLGAAAMAADAQHLVVLRALAGDESLPTAFETGGPG